MNKISLTLITVIVGILLIFTFLQMERPAFEVGNKFIIIPQNSIVANDMSNIINNIVEIASDQQNNESVEKKRAMVEVERLNETSMFKVNVFAQSEKDVKELNEGVIYNILKDVSEYYDIKTDINIDLVKGDDVVQNDLNKILPIIFWALVGILISILIVMIVELVSPKKNNNEKVVDLRNVINNVESNQNKVISAQVQNNVESTPVYNLQDSVNTNYEFSSFRDNGLDKVDDEVVNAEEQLEQNEKEEEIVEIKKKNLENSNLAEAVKEEVVEKKFEEVKSVKQVTQKAQVNLGVSRSGAPSNLPVVEFNAASESDENISDEQLSDSGSDEPTEEELKARLNKLLKGEM